MRISTQEVASGARLRTPVALQHSVFSRVFRSVFHAVLRTAASLLVVAVQFLGASALPAQDAPSDPPEIEAEITVTANRFATPVDAVGSSVTVLDADEIERRGKTSVAELLRTVPGVEVVSSYGFGSQTSVFLRGASSTHTLVLVDGVRVNSSTVGSYDFADLTTDNLERIEILRGPQSTLYGSEAIGGVVSITTRRGEGEPAGSLRAEAGSREQRRVSASVRGGAGRFDYSLTAADGRTDGISAAAFAAPGFSGAPEADGHQNLTLSARLGMALPRDGRLDLSVRRIDAELEVDGFGPEDDPNATQRREGLIATFAGTLPLTSSWTQTWSVGVHDETLTGEDPDSSFNVFGIDARTTEVSTQANVEVGSGVVSIGGGWERREAKVEGFGYDDDSDIASLFAHYQGAWSERFHYTLGARHDDHSEFGGETTFRATGSYAWPAGTRLHASVGTGFRAPALNELYFPFFGNPELDPETSEGFDLGIEQTWLDGRLVVDATYFDNDFDGLVGFDDNFVAINVDRATSRGIEFQLSYRVSERFDLGASHTWDRTEDLGTGLQLARRPENRSVLDLHLRPVEGLDGTLTAISVRDRVDTGGQPLEDYLRVDLHVGYRISPLLAPYVRIENLFDEDYQEILGFQTPGFTAALGVDLRFGPGR